MRMGLFSIQFLKNLKDFGLSRTSATRSKNVRMSETLPVDETVITERNGTWVLVLKYNMQTGSEQEDLDAIDNIIDILSKETTN
jgi:hypothetical protein